METNPRAAIGEVIITDDEKMMTVIGGEYSNSEGEWRYGCSNHIDGENSVVHYITDHKIIAVFRNGEWT